jgi:hypothetical protein
VFPFIFGKGERKEVLLPVEDRPPLLGHAFGSAEWKEYFGVVVDSVPLPPEIKQALLSHPTQFVLALIPSEVGIEGTRRPLDFTTGIALLEGSRSKGHPFVVSRTSRCLVQTRGVAHWVLLTKESLAETLGQTYEKQVEMLQAHSPPYRTPTAWEAFLCIALHKIHTGETLYAAEPQGSPWMRCQKEEGKAPFVGGHDRKGLRIKPQEALAPTAPNIGMAGAL